MSGDLGGPSENADLFLVTIRMSKEWWPIVGESPPPHSSAPKKLHAILECALASIRPTVSTADDLPRIVQVSFNGSVDVVTSALLGPDTSFAVSGLAAAVYLYAPPTSLLRPIEAVVAAFQEALPAPTRLHISERQWGGIRFRTELVDYYYSGGSRLGGTWSEGHSLAGESPH